MEASREMPAFQKFQIVLYVLIWLVGTIGCLLVMSVIVFSSKSKSTTNVFLLNLAVADIVYLQGIPLFLTALINRQWLFSLFTCKLFWTMIGVNQYTAVFILTLLAFDRYLAVCRPDLSSWRRVTSSKMVLAGVWLFSITCLLPVIIFSNVDETVIELRDVNQSASNQSFTIKMCTILWPEETFVKLDEVFTIYGFIVSFIIPIGLISLSYTRIIIRLKRSRSEVSPQLRAKQRERRKVTYLVLVIIGIYMITYTPYWVLQIFLLVSYLMGQGAHGGSASGERMKATLSALFQLLVYSNSALNPFIYAFMSVNFRSNFHETFKCDKIFYLFRTLFARSPPPPNYPSPNRV